MIKIGYVDHHLNNYHSSMFLKLLHGVLSPEECRIVGAYESHQDEKSDWCSANNIKKYDSLEELMNVVDAVIVLAPNNPEAHLELCKQVFKFKKPVFIDKFLAPTLAEAKAIVSLAKINRVKIMSCSSLAFAVELEKVLSEIKVPIKEMYARGMSNWYSYGIHTIAMVIRIMGPKVNRVIDTGNEKSHFITLDYGKNKMATVEVREAENHGDCFPWQFGIKVGNKYIYETITDFEGFYTNLMREVIKFFKTGKTNFPVESALAAVYVLEKAIKSQQAGGKWVK